MQHGYPSRRDILIISLHPSPRSVRSAEVTTKMTGRMYARSGKSPRCCSRFLLLTSGKVYGPQLPLEGGINNQVRTFLLLLPTIDTGEISSLMPDITLMENC